MAARRAKLLLVGAVVLAALASRRTRQAARQPEAAADPVPESFLGVVRADVAGFYALQGKQLSSPAAWVDALFFPGPMAVLLFRVSAALHQAGLRPLSRLLYILNVVLFGADLAPATRAGPGLVIPHPVGVAIAGGTTIGRNVLILKGVALGGAPQDEAGRDGFPTVGDGCALMDGAKVLGPVQIGPGARIGANALVMRSVPAGAVVSASPARVVRYRPGYGPSAETSAT